MSDMFKRFTERSVKAFRLALDESESLGQAPSTPALCS